MSASSQWFTNHLRHLIIFSAISSAVITPSPFSAIVSNTASLIVEDIFILCSLLSWNLPIEASLRSIALSITCVLYPPETLFAQPCVLIGEGANRYLLPAEDDQRLPFTLSPTLMLSKLGNISPFLFTRFTDTSSYITEPSPSTTSRVTIFQSLFLSSTKLIVYSFSILLSYSIIFALKLRPSNLTSISFPISELSSILIPVILKNISLQEIV